MKVVVAVVVYLAAGVFFVAAGEMIPLWPEDHQGIDTSIEPTDVGGGRFKNIRNPSITVFEPEETESLGVGVVVCPGGGYHLVSYENEGREVAEWLNSIGVSAFVLKYRLPSTAEVDYSHPAPLKDAQHAIRIVRERADEFGVDPGKIGICGFSAGGHLAATVGTLFEEPVEEVDISCRPDFMILIYPVVSFSVEDIVHKGSRRNLIGADASRDLKALLSPEKQVATNTPPAFIVHSSDDRTVDERNSVKLYMALQKSGVPAELHIYKEGGHGYGLGREGTDSMNWPQACAAWLRNVASE